MLSTIYKDKGGNEMEGGPNTLAKVSCQSNLAMSIYGTVSAIARCMPTLFLSPPRESLTKLPRSLRNKNAIKVKKD
jgi:hypothetical protein